MSVFFFFKQKTAYEMRISDWSSDVCSSDLPGSASVSEGARPKDCAMLNCVPRLTERSPAGLSGNVESLQRLLNRLSKANDRSLVSAWCPVRTALWLRMRSEEHTSELQSLMRISYAVFCLKKNKI